MSCLALSHSRVPVGASAGVQEQAHYAHRLRSEGQRTPGRDHRPGRLQVSVSPSPAPLPKGVVDFAHAQQVLGENRFHLHYLTWPKHKEETWQCVHFNSKFKTKLCSSKIWQSLIQRSLRWKCKFGLSSVLVSSYTRPPNRTRPLEPSEALQSDGSCARGRAEASPEVALCHVSAGITVGSWLVTVEAEFSAGLWVTSRAVLPLTTGWRMKAATAVRAVRCAFLWQKDGTIAGTAGSSSARSKMCSKLLFPWVWHRGSDVLGASATGFWLSVSQSPLPLFYCNCEILRSHWKIQKQSSEIPSPPWLWTGGWYCFIFACKT